jgi:integrase
VRGKQWRQTLSVGHAEAVRLLKDKQSEVATVGAPPSRLTTVGDIVKQYLDAAEVANKRGTVEHYDELYRLHIADSDLANVKLARLTDADVQSFINERLKSGKDSGRWGARRVEMMAALLRSSFNLAMQRRPPLIGWNPLAGGKHKPVKLPKVPKVKIKPLSQEQAMLLLEAIAGHEHEHLYWLLLATGLRIGEALGLQWSDVDWQARTLRVEHNLDPLKGRQWSLDDPKNCCGRAADPAGR